MTLVKSVKLLPKLIFLKKGLGMMFDDVPYIKKSLPRLHKCHFNIVGKCPFFQRSKPMIFVNNLKVHLSLIFFEKDLDMMFDNVLNEKKKLS